MQEQRERAVSSSRPSCRCLPGAQQPLQLSCAGDMIIASQHAHRLLLIPNPQSAGHLRQVHQVDVARAIRVHLDGVGGELPKANVLAVQRGHGRNNVANDLRGVLLRVRNAALQKLLGDHLEQACSALVSEQAGFLALLLARAPRI